MVFCALPHGTTQEVIAKLPRHLKVVDLSTDFRLADVASYAQWYGHEHKAPELQKEAVYGLTETGATGDASRRGWWPIPAAIPPRRQLPLIPLLASGADRGRRHHHRRQVGRERRRARRQAGQPLRRGQRGHPCLWHRRPSPRAGDRAGAERGGGQAGRGQFHAASDADEPRHPVLDLCEAEQWRHRRRAAGHPGERTTRDEPFVRAAAERAGAGDAPCAGLEPLRDECRSPTACPAGPS